MSIIFDDEYWKRQMQGKDNYYAFDGKSQKIINDFTEFQNGDKNIKQLSNDFARNNKEYQRVFNLFTKQVFKGIKQLQIQINELNRIERTYLRNLEKECNKANSRMSKSNTILRSALPYLDSGKFETQRKYVIKIEEELAGAMQYAFDAEQKIKFMNSDFAEKNLSIRNNLIDTFNYILRNVEYRIEAINKVLWRISENESGKAEKLLEYWRKQADLVRNIKSLENIQVLESEIIKVEGQKFYEGFTLSDLNSKKSIYGFQGRVIESARSQEDWLNALLKNFRKNMYDVERYCYKKFDTNSLVGNYSKVSGLMSNAYKYVRSNLAQMRVDVPTQPIVDRIKKNTRDVMGRVIDIETRNTSSVLRMFNDFNGTTAKLNRKYADFKNYTNREVEAIGINFSKNRYGAKEPLENLLKTWEKYRNYSLEQVELLKSLVKNDGIRRRLRLLTSEAAKPDYDNVEESMKRGALKAYREKNTMGRSIKGDVEFIAHATSKMEGEVNARKAFMRESYEEMLRSQDEIKRANLERIRVTAQRMQGEKLATDAMKNFAKFVEAEAKNLKESVDISVKTKGQVEQEYLNWVKKQYFEELKISRGKQKMHTPAFLELLSSFIEDITNLLKQIFREVTGMLEKTPARRIDKDTGEIVTSIKPKIVSGLKKAVSGATFLFKGFIEAWIIEKVMEQIADLWVEVIKGMIRRHKQVEDLMSYEVFCGVTVERFGYNVFSFDDLYFHEILIILTIRIIGKLIAEGSINDEQFRDLVNNTLRNNPDSLVAQVKSEDKSLTANAVNAVENNTVILYSANAALQTSLCIVQVAYEPSTNYMFISFGGPKSKPCCYWYRDVPKDVILGFMKVPANAKSIGEYFNHYIRPFYRNYKRFGSLNGAVGNKKGKLEKAAQVRQRVVIEDKVTNLYISEELVRNKEFIHELLKRRGATGWGRDPDGRIRFYYQKMVNY